jgi:hypothetical protein
VERIQLWSDEKGGEFAVCLSGANGAFLSQTNPRAMYVKLVEEAEYIEGEKYDWAYMLAKWIEGRDGNGIATWVPHIPENVHHRQPPEVSNQKPARKRRKKYTKQKPTLKCHFCSLMYVKESERSGHEKEWHAESRKR